MFWRKTDKEKLVELLEWFLGHDWKFLKSDYRKLRNLNTLLLRFDTQPVWVNFSFYDFFHIDQKERERLFEAYKKFKGKTMREIKFRAWNFYEKKMYLLEAIDVRFELVTVTKQNSDKQGYDAYFRFSEIELMQCTGLKDKNGTEIYEGDIVKDNDGDLGKIFYDETEAAFKIDFPDSYFYLWEIDVEVVGNIYENPELLQ